MRGAVGWGDVKRWDGARESGERAEGGRGGGGQGSHEVRWGSGQRTGECGLRALHVRWYHVASPCHGCLDGKAVLLAARHSALQLNSACTLAVEEEEVRLL